MDNEIESIKVKIEENPPKLLEGTNPVVIIGPNGSGKTRYDIQLSRWNNANFIVALRNTSINPQLTIY